MSPLNTRATRAQHGARGAAAHHGFTILELLIALTLSLFVIAALGLALWSGSQTARTSNQMASMSETGEIVMFEMTDAIREAGYGEICCSNPATNVGQTLLVGTSLRACATASLAALQTAAAMSCPANAAPPGLGLVVRFQAQSVLAPSTGQAATPDCTGSPPANVAAAGTLVPVDQNIYIYDATAHVLSCAGAAGTTTLAADVRDFQMYFGFDDAGCAASDGQMSAAPRASSLYTADQINRMSCSTPDPWLYVVAVDLCFELRTSEGNQAVSANPAVNTYTACPQTSLAARGPAPVLAASDGYLHRTFRRLITVRAHATADPSYNATSAATLPAQARPKPGLLA